MNLANVLTTIRLIFAPVFLLLLILGFYGWALVIFCIAGFTDLIDGSVARYLGTTTRYGAVIDPLADKLLLGSCFISLTVFDVLPLWFTLIAIGRDLLITCGIFYLRFIQAPLLYRATYISKVATFLQLAIAVIGLVFLWNTNISLIPVLQFLCYVTALLLVVTGGHYVWLGFKLKAKRENI
ncbi:MAG: CDP-alcohol phosphatidyltransferase family protein [Pseudomonadota bacterium]